MSNKYLVAGSKNLIRSTCIVTILFSLTFFEISCRKLVEVKAPVTSLSEKNVYNTDAGAISVLTGLYFQMSANVLIAGNNSISLMTGLYSDEFELSNAVSSTDTKYFHYKDTLFSNALSTQGTQYWSTFYNYIFRCNAAIIGISESSSLSPNVKKQLLGEAKFMRAFFYFYLTNLYGDIPLALTTQWQVNSTLVRASQSQVYQQIISDLKEAEELLSDNYLDANLKPFPSSVVAERVRPTKWAATALLARAYLYFGDLTHDVSNYANAETQATILINNTTKFSLPSLSSAFLRNSAEAIWQLQPVGTGQNTSDGALFILPSTGPSSSYPVYLSSQLLSSFEANDQRRFSRKWVDSVKVGSVTYYFPYKYKLGKDVSITQLSQLTEYYMMFRLGEQYLIRAEAKTQQGKVGEAQQDLNAIRTRAGLLPTSANDKTSLLAAILKERQVELFSEWGHRWFDLKRTGTADAVMTVVRPLKANGAPWQSWRQLFPILYADILKNTGLTQNQGYQ